MNDIPDWANAHAPSLADIEAIADHAFAKLPDAFRALCKGLIIRVDDFPDDDTLKEMEAESDFDLLGLFHGRGMAQGEIQGQTGELPNMVFLYRRPMLDYWAEHEESLAAVVTHVLVHEIGHHFGLSDDDMEKIEAMAARSENGET